MADSEALEAALHEAERLASWLREDRSVRQTIRTIANRAADCLAAGGRIISCGNGGSMCDAMHFAEELTGRFHRDRPPLAAMAVSDPGHISCTANDFGYEAVFARAVQAWGRPGDLLVAISTSGNSPNVLAAVQVAKERQMTVVGLAGRDGGKLATLADLALVVPAERTDRIQEVHIKVLHMIIEQIELRLFPDSAHEQRPVRL
ncbi:MAG TPA: D-sedoheptulose 7-phosphate isomerase, partial [Planctomycetaceae bacterium]|nr:D-sedoheptulose 7-phosphate isomerase [Planctomycetaceae bacterium]